ncbi:MAG: phosphate signaling complex protein PhoU [Holosporales bacterium]
MGTQHIVRSYDQDLSKLHGMLEDMGKRSLHALKTALEALVEVDHALAETVIEGDRAIDHLEHEIDTFALRMIALRQPMAEDLRRVIVGLKISSHLERIADYATNIARRAISLQGTKEPLPALTSLERLGRAVIVLTQDGIHAFLAQDDGLCKQVRERDCEIDDMYTSYVRELITFMLEDPRTISASTQLLFVAKNLERIGDHMTDIVEMVHFMLTGHTFADPRPKGRKHQ